MNVIIFSKEFDSSTDKVIEWLDYYGAKVKRINNLNLLSQTPVKILMKTNENLQYFYFDDFISNSITSIWIRQAEYLKLFDYNNEDLFEKQIIQFLTNEYEYLLYSISDFFGNCKILGSKFDRLNISKIDTLLKAQSIGLSIPATILTNSKNELVDFRNKFSTIITKPIFNSKTFTKNDYKYTTYTKLINSEFIESLNLSFFPSLIQEYIEKIIEIRVFYLEGKCFSAALFSQVNETSKYDCRNNEHFIRIIPYKLPDEIEVKIFNLMKLINLNIGVLDLIYSTERKYIFLEVNPVGQYEIISEICNFKLNKLIAQWLIN